MKKWLIPAICFALLIAFVPGCTTSEGPGVPSEEPTPEPGKNVEGSLEDILQTIYDNLDPSVELSPFLQTTELSKDMGGDFGPGLAYYIGTEDVDFAEGLVSEPAIGAQPYSLVLLRMDANADMEAAKALIQESADPAKWICVFVDPSDVIVDSIGDLLILIMSEHSALLHESFLKLAE